MAPQDDQTPQDKLHSLELRVWEATARIESHERYCELKNKAAEEKHEVWDKRLDKIDDSLSAINKNVFLVGISLILGMGGFIFSQLLR